MQYYNEDAFYPSTQDIIPICSKIYQSKDTLLTLEEMEALCKFICLNNTPLGNRTLSLDTEWETTWKQINWLSDNQNIVLKQIKTIIRKGANPNCKNKNGLTPLSYAISHNQKLSALYLIYKTRDLNTQSIHGNTAMHCAAYLEDINLMHCLAVNGASFDIPNSLNQTPIDISEKYGNDYARQIKEMIQEHTTFSPKRNLSKQKDTLEAEKNQNLIKSNLKPLSRENHASFLKVMRNIFQSPSIRDVFLSDRSRMNARKILIRELTRSR